MKPSEQSCSQPCTPVPPPDTQPYIQPSQLIIASHRIAVDRVWLGGAVSADLLSQLSWAADRGSREATAMNKRLLELEESHGPLNLFSWTNHMDDMKDMIDKLVTAQLSDMREMKTVIDRQQQNAEEVATILGRQHAEEVATLRRDLQLLREASGLDSSREEAEKHHKTYHQLEAGNEADTQVESDVLPYTSPTPKMLPTPPEIRSVRPTMKNMATLPRRSHHMKEDNATSTHDMDILPDEEHDTVDTSGMCTLSASIVLSSIVAERIDRSRSPRPVG